MTNLLGTGDQKDQIEKLMVQLRYERKVLTFSEHKTLNQAHTAPFPEYTLYWIERPGDRGAEFVSLKEYHKDQNITRFKIGDDAQFEEVTGAKHEITIYRKLDG